MTQAINHYEAIDFKLLVYEMGPKQMLKPRMWTNVSHVCIYIYIYIHTYVTTILPTTILTTVIVKILSIF